MVTLRNKKTGEVRTWATDNAELVERLERVGWEVLPSPRPSPAGERDDAGLVSMTPTQPAPESWPGWLSERQIESLNLAGYTPARLRVADDDKYGLVAALVALDGIGTATAKKLVWGR